jgi:hypothetical protein
MTSRKQKVLLAVIIMCLVPTTSEGLSFFQDFLRTHTSPGETVSGRSAPATLATSSETTPSSATPSVQGEQHLLVDRHQEQPFTIAGLKPSNIASLLNTVSETGFSYFNVDDQCRSRTACDVGYMLYKKLNFVHNWIIRASVRTLVDSNNIYAQSWTSGMTGKNCTHIYPACNQSPLDSLMNFALLAG